MKRFRLGSRTAIALAIAANTLALCNAGAAPGIYPTGVTRYDPARAYNRYVLFTGQDKQTHLISAAPAVCPTAIR